MYTLVGRGLCTTRGVSELPIIWPPAGCNGNDYHLLGDSAYPLSTSLIARYRDNGHLSQRQKKLNTLHSSTRVVIERAFGLLKGKWSRLKYLPMEDLKKVPVVITLHVFYTVSSWRKGTKWRTVNDSNECQAADPKTCFTFGLG